ncbi:class I SAM-dependent methyltransferase [Longimicrobium sp.]|uniref:class I SAM-dependent methyltransferase n=1 Tax=Longimicrobium sp. TaxID=2029185 RepID=UPI002F95D659
MSGAPTSDPTARFSDRVADYVRYRPGYPDEVIRVLREETGLAPVHVVADVGSGTGISSKIFLDHGNRVFAVEPNPDMRAAAEAMLGGDPRFHSVAGTAEASTLPDAAVDYAVAGQAFHWFDAPRARDEFRRIVRPGGWAVLLWNARRTDTSPFLRAYEALLHEHGTDYTSVNHENITDDTLRAFFGGSYTLRTAYNEQVFDYAGLKGRLLSSSYAPNEGQPGHTPMLRAMERIFGEHQVDGRVVLEYDTKIYFAPVHPG